MNTMRVLFEKTGLARYISHLDLNRCMQRAISRAGIPVWYTQGFNPHPYITFALPLSLGCESECEIMDIRLEDDAPINFPQYLSQLSRQLPDGITVKEAFTPTAKASDLSFARYRLEFEYENESETSLSEHYQALMEQPSVMVTKETKRSKKEIDVLPYLKEAQFTVKDNSFTLEITLPAGSSESISPGCIADAMENTDLKPVFCRMKRLALFDGCMKPFR